MYLAAQYGMRPRRGMMYLSGRASSKTRRSMGRYLSALTADQATEQVFPAASVKTSAGHNQAVRDQILASVNAGQIVNAQGTSDYVPGTSQCAATGQSTNVKLAQTAAGLALQGTTIGLTAAGTVTAAVLAPWTLGISAIIGLFPIFFGHHAAAVKKEQSVLCTAVPAANNYLQVIAQAVQQGMATPQQGIAALNSLLSDFGSQVASIRQGSGPNSSGTCNAACVEYAKLNAIVISMTSQFQDMITAANAPATSAVTGAITSSVAQVAASTGIPPLALYAIGGLLLWKLL
jgi:hypothetical protein